MKRTWREELPHYGQILTTKRTIVDFIRDADNPVTVNTIWLMVLGLDHPESRLRLYSVCARLYYLSKLVYKGKNGLKKLPDAKYKKGLFEGHAETVDEIMYAVEHWNVETPMEHMEISRAHAEEVFARLTVLEDIWCRFLACLWEQAYIPEYAYAFEYVMKKDVIDLVSPEYTEESDLFPQNYEDFNYTEGIVVEFENIAISIF